MKKNKLKEELGSGGVAVGTFAKFSDPSAIEILALAGFDFFVLDNEHVALNRESITNIIRAAQGMDIVPIIRVRKNIDIEILQALDSGAAGVMVPQVNSVDEAKECVSYVKYSPLGKRGFAPTHRAALYGTLNPAEYAQEANETTFIGCYCETKEAVRCLDEILKIEGIDMIFIGPMDLSQSYGYIGRPDTPLVKEAIDEAIEKIKKSNKAAGIIASDAADARKWIDKGVRFITISSDQGMMMKTAKDIVSEAKKLGIM